MYKVNKFTNFHKTYSDTLHNSGSYNDLLSRIFHEHTILIDILKFGKFVFSESCSFKCFMFYIWYYV